LAQDRVIKKRKRELTMPRLDLKVVGNH